MITLNKRDAWFIGGVLVMLVVAFVFYFVGRSDGSPDIASQVASRPSAASVMATVPDSVIQEVCPGWRIYRGTAQESVLRQAFLEGFRGTSGYSGYSDEEMWAAARARLEADCVTVY